MPAELWPPLTRGSRQWLAELKRVSGLAAEACDEGRDPSIYFARLEEMTGQPIDSDRFRAKLGPKWSRTARKWLRKAAAGVFLTLVLIAGLPIALLWPLIVGAGYLLKKVEPSYWNEVRRQPWGAVRLILRLLFVGGFRRQIGERIVTILCEEDRPPSN